VWLSGSKDRRIVLSAHSLGAVLAVGCILSARITESSASRMSLLTYGTQLRAYFGRIFPELLGPEVLDTPGCCSSRLFAPDPWTREDRREEPDAPATPVKRSRSLRARLGAQSSRWKGLWRRTDYLGFPVWSYAENSIDTAAEEVLTVGYLAEIQTHGGYTRTLAYEAALRDLLGVVRPPRVPTPDTTSS
jgi:hypothetical protein